jgi:alkyl hydroperoxide reductase subunit AhpF
VTPVGELGGLPLIKNAVNQGRNCVDTIAARPKANGAAQSVLGVYDLLVVGAGPGGISASSKASRKRSPWTTARSAKL